MIPVTRPFLPDMSVYYRYLDGVFERNWLTNHGPLYQELTTRLEGYLNVKHLLLVSNGTIALQIALKALGIEYGAKAITTPFTFAATAGALNWQGVDCHFSDIDPGSFNLAVDGLSPEKMSDIDVIMAVHVFGNPSNPVALEELANKVNTKLIFDAAHAFSVQYQQQSLLNFGDASTLSFHATKLFHCIEGGAIVFKEQANFERAQQLINFGLTKDGTPLHTGINGKLSEVHCAMGLAVLDQIDDILSIRMEQVQQYKLLLNGVVDFQVWENESANNGAYMPVLFRSETELLKVKDALEVCHTSTRRYFYPSLNTLDCYRSDAPLSCPVSEDIASRILCLPLYVGLTEDDIVSICTVIKSNLIR